MVRLMVSSTASAIQRTAHQALEAGGRGRSKEEFRLSVGQAPATSEPAALAQIR